MRIPIIHDPRTGREQQFATKVGQGAEYSCTNRTMSLAVARGAGAILVDEDGGRWRVSDWSPATGQVYGHPLTDGDVRGAYQLLPTNLEPAA